MVKQHFSTLIVSALTFIAVSGFSAAAFACSIAAPSWLPASNSLQASTDGPIVAMLRGGYGESIAATLVSAALANSAGDVAGAAELVEATDGAVRVFFTPSDALEVGAYTLSVQVEGEYGAEGTIILQVDVSTAAPVELVLDAFSIVESESLGGPLVCCELPTESGQACFGGECGGYDACRPCWNSEYEYSAAAMLEVSLQTDTSHLHEFRVLDGNDAPIAVASGLDRLRQPHLLNETEASCLRIEATNVLTGEVIISNETCVSDEEITRVPRRIYDASGMGDQCEPGTGTIDGEPVSDEQADIPRKRADAGCACSSSAASGAAAPALLLMFAFMTVGRRRRRRLTPPRAAPRGRR